ncbi:MULTISPECIES: hypothetical protein [Bradyrhizobium]|uniref:hypothetical protein n=1 Tax=Bradyrhizobium TaxID=374 RepID=UPI000A04F2D9|nr:MULTISPECIES: hypothetical protein [Bradyrhizobium]UFW51500.1 hypothetical protein BaraCB756_11225 [Bradyrhizobium arachidis]
MKAWLSVLAATVALIIGAQFISIFVVQPIGALPEGRTVILLRYPWKSAKGLAFIDSADAFCARNSGGVTLLCRGITAGAIAKNATILARLPYSATLYGISTGGRTYER